MSSIKLPGGRVIPAYQNPIRSLPIGQSMPAQGQPVGNNGLTHGTLPTGIPVAPGQGTPALPSNAPNPNCKTDQAFRDFLKNRKP